MKVIFTTNIPSPYRVDFFNELGKSCDLTVVYERVSSAERDSKWKGSAAINFEEVFLNLQNSSVDLAKGSALKEYVKSHNADFLFFTNYSSPATREAIIWCRLHGRKYYMEYDGGFCKKDPFLKSIIKKILLRGAEGHFTTADEHIRYLLSLGINQNIIYKYPFTSVTTKDLEEASSIIRIDKSFYKQKLGISEQRIVLTVGRFSNGTAHRKGYDVLMDVAAKIGPSIGFYFVGEDPTDEFTQWKISHNLTNVHFVGFKTKRELAEYYAAADIFVLLTREDIWGLVINEAMAYGLPIITTNTCIAGLELVKPGRNGYLVSFENQPEIIESILSILQNGNLIDNFKEYSLKKIQNYTISEMSKKHLEIFKMLSNHTL